MDEQVVKYREAKIMEPIYRMYIMLFGILCFAQMSVTPMWRYAANCHNRYPQGCIITIQRPAI